MGHRTHRYHFRLMALDVAALNISVKAMADEVRAEAQRHRIGEAAPVSTREHPSGT